MKDLMLSICATAATIGLSPALADEEDGQKLVEGAKQALEQCKQVAPECGMDVRNAVGVLVFPEVLHAHLIAGGAGGNGVLMQNGEPVAYYDIGKASVGLQAGIDEAAIVYVFREQESLADLTDGDEWEWGASAGATVGKASADAKATSGDPTVYVFDADGLNTEINVSLLRIWEDPENAIGYEDEDMLDDDDDMRDGYRQDAN